MSSTFRCRQLPSAAVSNDELARAEGLGYARRDIAAFFEALSRPDPRPAGEPGPHSEPGPVVPEAAESVAAASGSAAGSGRIAP